MMSGSSAAVEPGIR